MDDKTAELRDIFIDATGSDTVTETQEASRGSLASDGTAADERLAELVATMRERYAFETDLSDDELRRLVRGFHDGESDAALADALGVDEATAVRARLDLHLVRESDRDAPFDFGTLRSLVAEGADVETCVAELDADVDADVVRRYRAVAAADAEATRANDRFRDEFAELLTDSDLSARLAEDARRDGLREATEDIETDVSF